MRAMHNAECMRRLRLVVLLSVAVRCAGDATESLPEEVLNLRSFLENNDFGFYSAAEVDCAACEVVVQALQGQLSLLGEAAEDRQIARRGKIVSGTPVFNAVCQELRHYMPPSRKRNSKQRRTKSSKKRKLLRFYDSRGHDGDAPGIRQLREYCVDLLTDFKSEVLELASEVRDQGEGSELQLALASNVCVSLTGRCTEEALKAISPRQNKSAAQTDFTVLYKDEA